MKLAVPWAINGRFACYQQRTILACCGLSAVLPNASLTLRYMRMPDVHENYAATVKLINAGRFEEARPAILDLLRQKPDDVLAIGLYGYSLIRMDKFEKGVNALYLALFSKLGGVPKKNPLKKAYIFSAEDPKSKFRLLDLAASSLPGALLRLGRREEAAEIYRDVLELGFSYWFFNPQWGVYSALAELSSETASRILQADRERYARKLEADGVVSTWSPLIEPNGKITLRGATVGPIPSGSDFIFQVWEVRDEKVYEVQSFDAEIVSDVLGHRTWSASAETLPRGVNLVASFMRSVLPPEPAASSVRFIIPATAKQKALTGGSESVGCSIAVLYGEVASNGIGSRYRFEFGSAPDLLNKATPWQDLPPPCVGRVRDIAYRHPGHWSPRSIGLDWNAVEGGGVHPADSRDRLALCLKGPFHKDRNQTNGIGTHDVPLLFDWGRQRKERAEYRPGSGTLSVDGGNMDLRDAEISISFQADGLEEHDSSLILWIGSFNDPSGTTWSEWALTDTPVPRSMLHDEKWHIVEFKLRCAPFTWTYTGSNPEEQGDHADRHQRSSIATTLANADGPFVLDFALGQERAIQTGTLRLFDIAGRYRSRSILGLAAGTKLVDFPRNGICDPLNVSNSRRGYDDSLWTSATFPYYPLAFTWEFARPAHITHFQLNQHPYWPARDIEILGANGLSEAQVIWRGVLPQGRADLREPNYLRIRLESPVTLTMLKLVIVSGYSSERCGLDGLEVFGAGPAFAGDGQLCSVAEEVENLQPGDQIYYRIVLDERDQFTIGETRSLTIPSLPVPIIHFATFISSSDQAPTITVTINAMGLPSVLWVESSDPSGAPVVGDEMQIGEQPTSRHVHYCLGKRFRAAKHLRVVARNSAGTTTFDIH